MSEQLELKTISSADFNGIEMGVLEDGTSFLTGRGLATVCGVAPSVIIEWAKGYSPISTKPRDQFITRVLLAQGYTSSRPFVRTTIAQKRAVHAYPEPVCMALLEYYAFEAKEVGRPQAAGNYRVFARAGVRAFIYAQLGYDPRGVIEDRFRSYHERLLLNQMPPGYFSVFSETSHVVLASIREGLAVDSHTVPDISVGKTWSKHWGDNGLVQAFGERTKHLHKFPDDYPQAAAADPKVWVYPLAALGAFRLWLDSVYLPQKYPKYIQRKVRQGALPPSRAELLIQAVTPAAIGPKDSS